MEDTKGLGLKIGLEIHQQLNTKKLFCNCPSEIREGKPDLVVTRKLRASAGESGRVDAAAEAEMAKEKHYVYHYYREGCCQVELDEEPIHGMNKEALKIVAVVSKLLNSQNVDKIQVMRKIVVDGSNTSGFQRTALIGHSGFIQTDGAKIRIPTICLEEESAKIVDAKNNYITYNISRLGIPLVEIATAPDIYSPELAKEVAEKIGMVLRSTGKVKRGLGTIRQDLNVSIEEGARVEIKGAQELRLLPRLAQIEALRQKKLAWISSQLKERKANVPGDIFDITKFFSHCESKLIKETIEKGDSIIATRLIGFSGLIRTEIAPERRLGKEFSERARVASGVGGAIHTDELPKYGITEKDVQHLKEKLELKNDDAFIFICAPKEDAEKAAKAVIERAKIAINGVPSEVRRANPDGTTSYMRPMPSSSRMYPETDLPLVEPMEAKEVPELLTEKAKKFQSLGLSKDVAASITKSERAYDFEELVLKHKEIEPAFIADTMLSTAKEIKKRHGIEIELEAEELELVLKMLSEKEINKDAVFEIFVEKAKGKTVEQAAQSYKRISEKELDKILKDVVEQNKGMPLKPLIGKAMERLRGKAEGKKIVDKLSEILEQ